MNSLPIAPSTPVRPVADDFHGHRIVDPYRWLEDAAGEETRQWVDAQNAYTRALLDAVPGREHIGRRLSQLLQIGVVGAPRVHGTRYFYQRRDGQQNQPVLYVREGVTGPERVLLDPNAADAAGTTTLDWWYPSRDGQLLAYGYSQNGDERSTLHLLQVHNGEHLPDRIPNTRYASVAWLPDNSAFYYTRYPTPGTVPEGEEQYNVRFFLHRVGDNPQRDAEVRVAEMAREDMPWISISADGRYLLAGVHKGWERSDLYLRDLNASDDVFQPVAVGEDALFSGDVADGVLYVHTNLGAPRYRVFRVDPVRLARDQWTEIIPEQADAVLDSISLTAGHLVAGYMRNALSSITIFAPDSTERRDVMLPTLGTVTAMSGEWGGTEVFYTFESFTHPPAVYRLDPTNGGSEEWMAIDAGLRSQDYTIKQEWYTSRDGTPVSIFVVHRADLDRSRPHPTLLTGYGGFNLSRTPLFTRGMYLWLEAGGIYALPNLRGGGEYGEEWHRAGMLDRKQNVFDDFLGAAEWLIDEGYSESERLAIQGGSNGGLLVGAAMIQRPELFRAVVCAVPLLDMLRYHRFLIARLWIAEFGSADVAEQFPFIHAYSPYHHVVPGTPYPAVLLTTAESDTRVDPLHARKMAAALQAANSSDHPILLRVETQAGHGIGKPLTKIVEEQTDVWSFLFWQLGVEV